MRGQLEARGLAATFCDAVDGRTLTATERIAALSCGEQGALLSHMAVWRRLAKERTAALVLEDDCELLPSFEPALAGDLLRGVDAAIVMLGHHSARHPPQRGAEVCVFGRTLAPGLRL